MIAQRAWNFQLACIGSQKSTAKYKNYELTLPMVTCRRGLAVPVFVGVKLGPFYTRSVPSLLHCNTTVHCMFSAELCSKLSVVHERENVR